MELLRSTAWDNTLIQVMHFGRWSQETLGNEQGRETPVHFSSVTQSTCWTLCDPIDCSTRLPCPSLNPVLKLIFIELGMPSNHLILCRPLVLLPSIFPSIRVFSSESVLCIRWPKDWCFSFSISPSNEYSGLISIRMDWFDLLVVQGTLKSVPQFKECTTVQKNQFFSDLSSLWSSSHICTWLMEKTWLWLYRPLLAK